MSERCRCVLSPVVVRPTYQTLTVKDELTAQESDAWAEYLDATRGQQGVRYAEVEAWAWVRLAQRLQAIRSRRRARRALA